MQALRILASRWVVSFAGIAILALLVWFFGPLLEPLEGWVPRLAIVLALLLVWGISNLLLDLRRRRREQRLESGVAEKAPGSADDGAGEEALALRERMSTALALLKKARGTRGYLYEQPWYAIIGPPGAGKTTALLNSGLKFPLAAEMGQGAVAGVGGTRLCDWWFTENAVLIDTAGRYTTQDSNAAVDRAGWDSFLDLLRRTRPRQPLNGVIVAIALSDIADAPPAERAAHAGAIRRRIKELESRLGVRMPVYALFTKSDLIAGFTEFFDDLDRERRNQVWGVTFPLVKAEAGPVGQFPDELQLLVDRLNERLFDRLQAEQSPDRRALIAGFPTQIATLAQPLQGFLVEAFGGSRLDPAPLLRGVYFTSGTQEGTPIDRLTGVMARAFGLDQRRAAALRPQQGRSYFLGRLVSQVILGEAMLVSEPPAARARRIAHSCRLVCGRGPGDAGRRGLARRRSVGRSARDRHHVVGTVRLRSHRQGHDIRPRQRFRPSPPAAVAGCRAEPRASGAETAAASCRASTFRRPPSSAPGRTRSIGMPWAMRCCRAWSGGWKRRCAATSPSPNSFTRPRAST